jgi:membrane-associated protease RseP (regulator of RpoE activity)
VSDETPSPDPTQPEVAPAPAPDAPVAETPAAPVAETPAAPVAETPAAPVAPAAAAPTAPDNPVAPAAPAAASVAPETAPAAAPPAAPAAAPVAAPSGSHVAVPKWVLVTLAALVGAAAMFGIGYAVGDRAGDDDDTAAINTPFGDQGDGGQQAPVLPGPGDQGNGNRPAPQSPNPPASGAFLGVATQQTSGGLEIVQVVPGSAADDAGLEVGDVIVELDGNPVTTPAQLANAVGNLEPGDEVEITYERDGDSDTVTIELGSRGAANSN